MLVVIAGVVGFVVGVVVTSVFGKNNKNKLAVISAAAKQAYAAGDAKVKDILQQHV